MKISFWNMMNSPSWKCGPENTEIGKTGRPGNSAALRHKAESGVALLMVLILSAVALALMTALIYMTTIGTQTSGMHKRYHSALEAGIAGKDLLTLVISQHGDYLTLGGFAPVSTCTGTSVNTGVGYPGLMAKIMTSTTGVSAGTGWSVGCDSYLKIDPANSTSYDLRFTLGTNPQYIVYTKIVDVVEGNTGGTSNASGNTLTTQAVVSGNSGEVTVMSLPYLYTIEIDAENANPSSNERAKLQVLYQN